MSSDASGEDDESQFGDSEQAVSTEPDKPCPSKTFEDDDEGVCDGGEDVITDLIRVGPPKNSARNCGHDNVEKETGPDLHIERSNWRKQ